MARAFEGLGQALALLRTERRFSQSQLAERSGVNKSLISRYERGQVEPTFDSVNRLLEAMEASRHDLDEVLTRVQRLRAGAAGAAGVVDADAPEAYLVIPLGGKGRARMPEIEGIRLDLSRVVHAVSELLTDPDQARRELERSAAGRGERRTPEDE